MSNWKKGTTPNGDIVVRFSELFNVSTDYLLLGKEKSSTTELTADEQELLTYYKQISKEQQLRTLGRLESLVENNQQQKNEDPIKYTTTIKIYDYPAAAGVSPPFQDDDCFKYKQFKYGDVPTNADFGVKIDGDSMEPKYPNGGIAWVKRTQELNIGDAGIFILDNCPLFKICDKKGLKSLNPKYETKYVNDNSNFVVIGKVIGYYCE